MIEMRLLTINIYRQYKESILKMILLTTVIYLNLISPYRCCSDDVVVTLEGHNITSIPSNLNSSVTHLDIHDTKMTTLDLEQVSIYSELCQLTVRGTPITFIVAPSQPTKLNKFHLSNAYFPALPNLGDALPRQLRFCSWNSDGISTIPNDAFIHYTQLISLSLSGNPIESLNSSMMNGLKELKHLYLSNTYLNPLPDIYDWASKLAKLTVNSIGLTELPVAILVHLPNLRILQIQNNHLTTLPDKKYFVNLESMSQIDVRGNKLVCDQRLCWLKVSVKNYAVVVIDI